MWLNCNDGPLTLTGDGRWQMLLIEGSKPSIAAEGQSLHHFRCPPPPQLLRGSTLFLHPHSARTRETPASAPSWSPVTSAEVATDPLERMQCTVQAVTLSKRWTNNLLTIIEMLNSSPCNPLHRHNQAARWGRRQANFHYSKAHFIYNMGTLLCM